MKVTQRKHIRAGVVGFGLGGRVFHAAIIHATQGIELAAIVQRKGDEASTLYPEATIYRQFEDLIADPTIDLVAVTTPNDTHADFAKRALLAGKHVVVDKPFTITSQEALELDAIAREHNLVLSPYQNRRWDGDFRTVRKLLVENAVGALISYESNYERWRPVPAIEKWRDNGKPGSGNLLDLGSHLVDQAIHLLGLPTALWADVRTERDGGVSDDAFDIFLYYPTHVALLRSSTLSAQPGPRFTLRGSLGSFVKYGLDPQEPAILAGHNILDPHWGEEDPGAWGTLTQYRQDSLHADKVETLAGNYVHYYENVRDAISGAAPLAVTAKHAWVTATILEAAQHSSKTRTVISLAWPEIS